MMVEEENVDHASHDDDAINAIDVLITEALSDDIVPLRYVQVLHEMATFIENLEIEYAESSSNRHGAFDEDMRDDYRIGLILDSLNNHDTFLDSVLGRLVGMERNTTEHQRNVLASSYRLLMACSVGPNATAVSFAAEDSVVDVLLTLVRESLPPVRCYAIGLLSVALLERKVADRVVRQQIPQLLLQNLVHSNVAETGHFPHVFARASSSASENTKKFYFNDLGEAVSPLPFAKLQRLECNWTLQCLASMGEYQETLAPATHTGAIDVILKIFGSNHEDIHLDAVELVSCKLCEPLYLFFRSSSYYSYLLFYSLTHICIIF